YAPEIGIAICFSCNKLIYVGQQTKNIENYNHIEIEKHWATHCTGNSFCNISYDEYLQRMQNAIKKAERAREVELAKHYQLLWAVREEMRQ
ncbi:10072_t:CDS:2, partial [Gigaspora margarita]